MIQDAVPPAGRPPIASLLAGGLGLLWMFSGIAIALDWREFADAVAEHAVLPGAVTAALWTVPLVQFLLGTLMLLLCTHRRWAAPAALAGLALVAAFSAYLLAVPAETFERTGCACIKPRVIRHDRGLALLWNGGLAGLHAIAAAGLRRHARGRTGADPSVAAATA